MALTRSFRETVQKRALKDPAFRKGLLTEAIDSIICGEPEVAKSLLREYINATITFNGLAIEMKKNSKSIHRMLGPKGNPSLENIAGMLKVLQGKENIKIQVKHCRA